MLKKISTIVSIVLVTCTFGVQAFTFEPITQDYSPSGKGANHIFRVANPSDEKIAVKISIKSRSIEPDGTELQGEASELFMIYPRQIILNPNENRSIRIKWLGDSDPAQEIPFRIIAEQVPVSFSETEPIQGGQITLTYRYEGTLYIVPPGAKARIGIKSIKRETIGENDFLVLEVENAGTRHTLLNKIEVKLKRSESDPQPIILTDNNLKGVAGENMLADSVRIFRIPMPDEIWNGPIYGSIKQAPAK